ncbi:hypothetical protein OOT46_15760 [Aquabacterium sp. A7-Y]|uniref:hypothetical protein n=1 Tax=Aquabacterium sp. A7-Y TaxID=1349605 RepID=UPI00223E2354|nr:hypothetical protein [Aquabacterium sp. A7-Y]MCW7539300.1 hypothetical protein [Aquabacterium sp. A7-Y]
MTRAAATFTLSVTTQGPLYPPSEIVNEEGDFVVVGRIPRADGTLPWAGAIVSARTAAPPFGQPGVHEVLRWIDLDAPGELSGMVLHTLPLPLPCNNYPMLFAPEQRPQAHREQRASFPLHRAPVPDLRDEDGRRELAPVTLGRWLQARGELQVSVAPDARSALFEFSFEHLVPDSLYTVMSLRQRDLDPEGPTRPGPLGVPNVFVTDAQGRARYWARLPDPFPDPARPGANRIINVVVLFMSSQMSHGGAIGWYGLGGDIHAHLKLKAPAFLDLRTQG